MNFNSSEMRRRVARRSRVKMSEYHPLFKASGLCFACAPPILTKKCRHNAKNLKRNSKNLQFLFCGATNQKFCVFLDGDWRYTQEKKRSYFVLFFFFLLDRDDAKRRTLEVRDWTGRYKWDWRDCPRRRGTRDRPKSPPWELEAFRRFDFFHNDTQFSFFL